MRTHARAEGRTRLYDGRWRDRDPAEAPAGVAPVIRLKSPLDGETRIADLVQGEVKVANQQLDDMVLLRADGTEKWGVRGPMEDVLYVETHPPTHGYRRYSHSIPGGVDLLVVSAYDGCFELDQKEGWAREIFYFENLPSRLHMAVQLLRLFRRLGRKRYSLALFPLVRRRGIALALLAFLLLVRARHTVLYDLGSQRLFEVSLRDAAFRQRASSYVRRRLLGEDSAAHPAKAVLLLPLRLLRATTRVMLRGAAELTARGAYVALSAYLLIRGRRAR